MFSAKQTSVKEAEEYVNESSFKGKMAVLMYANATVFIRKCKVRVGSVQFLPFT